MQKTRISHERRLKELKAIQADQLSLPADARDIRCQVLQEYIDLITELNAHILTIEGLTTDLRETRPNHTRTQQKKMIL